MGYRRRTSPEERAERLAQLEQARVDTGRYETRDGREFLVVTLPDRYGESGPSGGRAADGVTQALDSLDDED